MSQSGWIHDKDHQNNGAALDTILAEEGTDTFRNIIVTLINRPHNLTKSVSDLLLCIISIVVAPSSIMEQHLNIVRHLNDCHGILSCIAGLDHVN